MFNNRKMIIATMHQKEKVLAPVMEAALGVRCYTDSALNTDLFGTFTGVVERNDDPISTARKKCLQAMGTGQFDLAIASEGSFGAHPSLFFVPVDEEILYFFDQKNELEIVVKEISTETNFNGCAIKSVRELWRFAEKCKFPDHALIIRKSLNDHTHLVKGITRPSELLATFKQFIASYGTAFVETDMRAKYNPLRMKVIERAAHKLVERINTQCPACYAPGFGITGNKPGLPCAQCASPTRSTLLYHYTCVKCKYSEEVQFPKKQFAEDPLYCDVCNP